jgi:hypothetical protein
MSIENSLWSTPRVHGALRKPHNQIERAARSGAAHVLRKHAPDIAGGLFVTPTIGCDQFIDAFYRLLFLAMLCHAGSICITPVVG